MLYNCDIYPDLNRVTQAWKMYSMSQLYYEGANDTRVYPDVVYSASQGYSIKINI